MEFAVEKACIIVLARRDSERLPGKNKYPVNGIPLYRYTFRLIKKLGLDCFVISDDTELLEKAREYGFNTIIEPKKYATPTGGDMELMKWVHQEIKKDIYFMLPLTSPVRDELSVMNWIIEFRYGGSGIKHKSALSVYCDNVGNWKENGSFYAWRKEQLKRPFIFDRESKIFQDDFNIDINTIEDIRKAEKTLSAMEVTI